MYSVNVRDHFMIAHSFVGDVFGPAQRLHGATYVVDATFSRPELDGDQVVVDIGRAADCLKTVLSDFNYKNLDELETFSGVNTTTEYLAREIFNRLVLAIQAGEIGEGARGVTTLEVTLAIEKSAKESQPIVFPLSVD